MSILNDQPSGKELYVSPVESLLWQAKANCIDEDPELFAPGLNEKAAKAVCKACDVRQECLEYALHPSTTDADYGVWGGKSEYQRKLIKFGRQIKSYFGIDY